MSMIGLVLTFFPVIVQVIANGIVRAHGDEPMSLVVTGPTSFPVTTSDSWAEDNIGEVEEAKESVLERRCIYSMHTPPTSSPVLRSMRPTRACAGGEELQAANDTLAVDQVDSGEFGLRSIRQACGTDEVGEPGGVLERSGMGESSKGEHFDSVHQESAPPTYVASLRQRGNETV
ncbi:hypothetical protein C8Q72DRAFT_796005 [Fomitopsis betulina]|nr:hypothetical protein C8Q72DRAFT_796005 [Fomitopsis betulina]